MYELCDRLANVLRRWSAKREMTLIYLMIETYLLFWLFESYNIPIRFAMAEGSTKRPIGSSNLLTTKQY